MKAGANSGNEQSHDQPEERAKRCPGWKRALDVTLILLTAPISLPLGFAIFVLIRVCSQGPAFFRQERIGHRGRSFYMVKFRTMKVGADTSAHRQHLQELIGSEAPMTKLDAKGDKRLVPFGAMLRATGLDELPQLLNVLVGEMSLVGPRPCMHYEYERYSAAQRRRFEALPGLTGLWQVSGKNNTTFSEMIRMDITYSQRASLWLDLKIIALTLPALTAQVLETRLAARTRARKSPATGEGELRKSGEII
jgi:lipopolysaccharide/colanic/teichoic acid biosynthesis glycosyltransferase